MPRRGSGLSDSLGERRSPTFFSEVVSTQRFVRVTVAAVPLPLFVSQHMRTRPSSRAPSTTSHSPTVKCSAACPGKNVACAAEGDWDCGVPLWPPLASVPARLRRSLSSRVLPSSCIALSSSSSE
eukprot:scaffold38725_cov28-Tisochrysis_lutea.AAC.2